MHLLFLAKPLIPDQRVYAYPADGSFDENIPTDYVLLSESEAQIKLKDYHTNWFNNLDYALKRQDEYPPFQDYLDAIVKNDAVQLQKYIDDCLAVKAKYPKQ